jgi:MFS superfamily sulfate permease-like transporter
LSANGQPSARRRFLPISFWLASYEKGYLGFDLIAALTVWALVGPEAIAYATLVGMPPETGLYAALVAPLAYAIFGTSRQLIVGPSHVSTDSGPRGRDLLAPATGSFDSLSL